MSLRELLDNRVVELESSNKRSPGLKYTRLRVKGVRGGLIWEKGGREREDETNLEVDSVLATLRDERFTEQK